MFSAATSNALAASVRAPAAPRRARAAAPARAARARAEGAASARDDKSESARRAPARVALGGALAALALSSTPLPALANDHYANDCDPICHVLDDGAAKSQAQEAAMKSAGPDMGDLMAQLQAQRKAEEAAAKATAVSTAKK